MNWVVEPEYLACVLIAIILGNSLFDHGAPSLKTTTFRASLFISFAAIFTNLIAIYLMQYAYKFPVSLLYTVNMIYFLLVPVMIGSITAVTFVTMYEERYEETCFRRAMMILLSATLLTVALVLANRATGWIFYFDAKGNYVRGILNKSNAFLLGVMLIMIAVCYLRERKKVRTSFRSIIISLELLGVILTAFQLAYPNTMLSGSEAALSLLVLFIYGQQQRIHEDYLTELVNRESFYRSLERLSGKNVLMHVLIVSLRDYKTINNRYGQRTGDQLLQQVSRYLQQLHPAVVTCRFSGVEFALIVPDIPEQEYENIFEKVVRRFELPWEISTHEIVLRAAMADITYPEHAANINELIASLEYAVRIAKSHDDGVPVRFNKMLRNEIGKRNYVISILEPAFKTDRYYLNFQPIYDCAKGRATGGEVLLRLREENGGTVSPAVFVPLAVEMGLEARLTWLVLRKTCAFLAAHRDCGIEWLSVNISVKSYQLHALAGYVRELLEKYQLPGSMLKLEITESVLIEDVTEMRKVIQTLLSYNVGVFLDDFGTGYSNLANVMSLPFECVKVDKSLVGSIEADPHAYALLDTVLRGLKAMRVKLLVEGVETEAQKDIVMRMGVDNIQGFYYAMPMDETEYLEHIQR